MNISYKISLHKIRQQHLKEIFAQLEVHFTTLGIDFYLLGAVARDIWMTGVHGNTLGRITRDIDWAVMIPTEEVYTMLKKSLLDSGSFTPSRENEYVVIYKDGTPVDLLPFGGIEREGKVTLLGIGLTIVQVSGFSEVYQHGTARIEFEEGQGFKVCTLPGIVLLKLIAFDDRPEKRSKDILDIASILKVYYSISDNEIFDQHFDLLDDGFEPDKAAARLLGRQMRPMLLHAEALRNRIQAILKTQIAYGENSPIAQILGRGMGKTIAEAKQLIEQLLEGTQEKDVSNK
jgi:predicted nucleotidyltransferase